MMLIHKNYSFPGNIQKISTPNSISPYIQIVEIQNKPLKPIIILNIYMPSHQEDITLIPIIKNEILKGCLNFGFERLLVKKLI
jgi:hypothetical protein